MTPNEPRRSHIVFSAMLVLFGLAGLITGNISAIWPRVPAATRASATLAIVCSLLTIVLGLCLLWRRMATVAARLLLLLLLLWLLVFKIPLMVRAPLVEGSYQSSGELAVIVAAAWTIFAKHATHWDRRYLSFAAGRSGQRFARVLFGLSMLAFGLSHFAYVELTTPLVPSWLGWPEGWAYFTGCTYLAAGFAVLGNVRAKLAAWCATWQMGLFVPLVWLPILVSEKSTSFRWNEFLVTCVLTVSAWVFADSYRDYLDELPLRV